MRSCIGVGLAMAAAIALTPASAHAGRYSVFNCRQPDGAAAPLEGWHHEENRVQFSSPISDCGGKGLVASLVGDHAQDVGAQMSWVYDAPADTTIWSAWVYRSTSNTAANEVNATPGTSITVPLDSHDLCVKAFGCSSQGLHEAWNADGNFVDLGSNLSTTRLSFNAFCSGTNGYGCVNRGGGAPPMAKIALHSIRVFLDDDSPPAVSSVAGSLVASGAVSGTRSLSIRSTDAGSGVYRAFIEVRRAGQASFETLGKKVLDDNNGHCAPVASVTDTAYAFLYSKPCRVSVSGDMDFDTRALPDGQHELRVSVEDASGNRVTGYGPIVLAVHNAPQSTSPPTIKAPNGLGAGAELICAPGSFDPAPEKIEYAWTVDGTPVEDAHAARFTVRASDKGKSIVCRVTATIGQAATTVNSAPAGITGGQTTGSSVDDTPAPSTNGSNGSSGANGSNGSNGSDGSNGPTGTSPATSGKLQLTIGGKPKRLLGYGRRTATVLTLRDANGRGVANAAIAVRQRRSVPGARFAVAGTPLVTDGQGHVVYRVPVGAGRTIRFTYGTAHADLIVAVRSRTTFRTSRRFLHNGQTLRFKGRVVSGPVPKGGVGIDLQAKVGSHWQTFNSFMTDRSGRWHAHYRFRSTKGLQTYMFRVRVRRDSGFAYRPSRSKRIKVKVRG